MGNDQCCSNKTTTFQKELSLANSDQISSFSSSIISSPDSNKLNLSDRKHKVTNRTSNKEEKNQETRTKPSSSRPQPLNSLLSCANSNLEDIRNSDLKPISLVPREVNFVNIPNIFKKIILEKKEYLLRIKNEFGTHHFSTYELEVERIAEISNIMNFSMMIFQDEKKEMKIGGNNDIGISTTFYGKMISRKKDIYFEGEIEDFLPKQGLLVHALNIQAESICGFFQNFCLEGFGEIKCQNGDYFKGTMQSGKKSGLCEVRWKDGERYKGHFLDDLQHGEGIYHYLNGDCYSGIWNNGTKNGKGKEKIVTF